MKQLLIAIDQVVNTLIKSDPDGWGWADETLSSRCWRNRSDPEWEKWRVRIDKVFFWDKDHCRTSYESELERRQLPPEMRVNEVKS
ncbi:MAG: hypothetical protein PHI31_09805 [Desulfuromonadaceae bacterium]|nr:hypothetical protein [Desulfuromonadaceae bacterium]